MTTVRQACRHVRSKNAGPFWVTVDFFFHDRQSFDKFVGSQSLSADNIGRIMHADPDLVRHYPVPDLNVLKISYPRSSPQGGVVERDMHSGQQYVRLLDLSLD